MNDLNKVWLIGRLMDKPVQAPSLPQPGCWLRVQTSHNVVDQHGTTQREWLSHYVEVLGEDAHRCIKHLDKNSLVSIEGVLRHHSVRAVHVSFLQPQPKERDGQAQQA